MPFKFKQQPSLSRAGITTQK